MQHFVLLLSLLKVIQKQNCSFHEKHLVVLQAAKPEYVRCLRNVTTFDSFQQHLQLLFVNHKLTLVEVHQQQLDLLTRVLVKTRIQTVENAQRLVDQLNPLALTKLDLVVRLRQRLNQILVLSLSQQHWVNLQLSRIK